MTRIYEEYGHVKNIMLEVDDRLSHIFIFCNGTVINVIMVTNEEDRAIANYILKNHGAQFLVPLEEIPMKKIDDLVKL